MGLGWRNPPPPTFDGPYLNACPQAPTQEAGVGAAWTTSPYRPEEDRRYSIDSIELPARKGHRPTACAITTSTGPWPNGPLTPNATVLGDCRLFIVVGGGEGALVRPESPGPCSEW